MVVGWLAGWVMVVVVVGYGAGGQREVACCHSCRSLLKRQSCTHAKSRAAVAPHKKRSQGEDQVPDMAQWEVTAGFR